MEGFWADNLTVVLQAGPVQVVCPYGSRPAEKR